MNSIYDKPGHRARVSIFWRRSPLLFFVERLMLHRVPHLAVLVGMSPLPPSSGAMEPFFLGTEWPRRGGFHQGVHCPEQGADDDNNDQPFSELLRHLRLPLLRNLLTFRSKHPYYSTDRRKNQVKKRPKRLLVTNFVSNSFNFGHIPPRMVIIKEGSVNITVSGARV